MDKMDLMDFVKLTEMKLTNVAKSSLGELHLDYEDFLRQRNLPQWNPDDPRRQELIDYRPRSANDVARWVKKIAQKPIPDKPSIKSMQSMKSIYSGLSANAAMVLIEVTISLLTSQIDSQAETYEIEGGFTERLYRVRKRRRRQ